MRRRTRLVLGAALVAIGVAGGVLVSRGGPAVGGFRSAEGYASYEAAYREALALGPDPAELDLSTDFETVRVLRYDGPADAQPLVLLPGTQSGAPMWVDNVPDLVRERTVYVVDLLGQPGMSAQSRPITSHAEDARWLAQALEQIPGDPALAGHSLGGWLAMNLAVQEPAAVSDVILIDPVLTFADLSWQTVVCSVPASVPWFPRGWREGFASWTANDPPVEDVPVARMIEAAMQGFSLGTPSPTRFSPEQLSAVQARFLVVVAGASRMHDADAVAGGAGELADAQVLTYDGASHAVTGEEPARLAEDVSEFLGLS